MNSFLGFLFLSTLFLELFTDFNFTLSEVTVALCGCDDNVDGVLKIGTAGDTF